ncbi:MAG: multicopper oxidase domain-containing protein [Burkholderiaceae bacterium]
MRRRILLAGATATGLVAGSAYFGLNSPVLRSSMAADRGSELPIPPVLELNGEAPASLKAVHGRHEFFAGVATPTLGFNQNYLGPVLRLQRGMVGRIKVDNQTAQPITAHWHGLHVNGVFDGGPQTAFDPGKSWSAELAVDQPAATLWYHSHVHGQTGSQVYHGLAGMMIVDDPSAGQSGLPDTYGFDDIPLIVQDRAFDTTGALVYGNRGPTMMHGFRASEIVVNGAIRPSAGVPAGLVRLRILNASNARIYHFSFEDQREFYQVGSDAGLLARPVALKTLELAPAERAEIVVDFSNGQPVRLMSADDFNSPMGGGMGHGMGRGMGHGMRGGMGHGMGGPVARGDVLGSDAGQFEVMRFRVNSQVKTTVTKLPAVIAGAPKEPDWGKPERRVQLRLDMHTGGMGGMFGRMLRGGGMNAMGINGRSMDMNRIDWQFRRNEVQRWEVISDQMAHPFHIHGTSFQVLTRNGSPVPYERTGMKDVVLVDGRVELLVRFTRGADATTPYMYHCHILEHEDAGMMGQFTVG